MQGQNAREAGRPQSFGGPPAQAACRPQSYGERLLRTWSRWSARKVQPACGGWKPWKDGVEGQEKALGRRCCSGCGAGRLVKVQHRRRWTRACGQPLEELRRGWKHDEDQLEEVRPQQ